MSVPASWACASHAGVRPRLSRCCHRHEQERLSASCGQRTNSAQLTAIFELLASCQNFDTQLAPEDSSSEIQNNQDLGSLIALACRRLMAGASFPNFQSNCPSAMWALLVQVKRDILARDTGGKERDC